MKDMAHVFVFLALTIASVYRVGVMNKRTKAPVKVIFGATFLAAFFLGLSPWVWPSDMSRPAIDWYTLLLVALFALVMLVTSAPWKDGVPPVYQKRPKEEEQ